MGSRAASSTSLGTVFEQAVAWGLPVSPLFCTILMMLAHAPYATPIIEPALFYLFCMAGAFVGFTACALVRTWNRRVSQFSCWFSGAVLEVAWFVLLWGERAMLASAVGWGSFLVGLSTAILLTLWLCVGQSPKVVQEISKLAVACATAFALYCLFSVIPHGGAVSYLFPVATCVPLAMQLHVKPLDQLRQPERVTSIARMTAPRMLTTSLLLASFGAGFAGLDFGGQLVEQGAGLAALLLVGCVLIRGKKDPLSLLRQIAMPLVAFSLCYMALFDVGNPFAFFLTGCAALAIWLYLAPRFDGTRLAGTTPHVEALLLGWIICCSGVGLATAYLIMGAIDTPPDRCLVALVMLTVLADFLWRAVAMTPPPMQAEASIPSRPITADDLSELGSRFGLSPRESQVAALLCESRSIGYICATLDLANSTAKTHIRHIYEKTGVHSKSELQVLAEKVGPRAEKVNLRAEKAGPHTAPTPQVPRGCSGR